MHRAQPSQNKICTRTWQMEQHAKHQKRKGKIRSKIDTSAPPVYPHLITRSKKEQMLEEKYSRIEYENRLLLKKMSEIMRPKPAPREDVFRVRSLNAVVRRKEMHNIVAENQALLKRIQARKPNYSREEWVKHSVNHSNYLENIRERPVEGVARRIQSAPKGSMGMAPRSERKKRDAGARLQPLSSEKKARAKVNAEGKDHISQGGHNIDGQYVLVTVDEIKEPHALFFRTYDLDTSVQCGVKVTFEDMKTHFENDNLSYEPDKREELANFLLPKLRFRNGELVLDPTATGPPEPAKEPTKTKKKPKGKEKKSTDAPRVAKKKKPVSKPASPKSKPKQAEAAPAKAEESKPAPLDVDSNKEAESPASPSNVYDDSFASPQPSPTKGGAAAYDESFDEAQSP